MPRRVSVSAQPESVKRIAGAPGRSDGRALSIPALEDIMTTAESIVNEYLERGYSLESLRVLAESRQQPLAGEMLAVIDAMLASGGAPVTTEDSGPCETAAFPVKEDARVVAEDLPGAMEAASEEGGVYFDIMADTSPESAAAGEEGREESVADIVVTEGGVPDASPAESKNIETASGVFADVKEEEVGIWSRIWSRVKTTPTLAPSMMGRARSAAKAQEAPPAASGVEKGAAEAADSGVVAVEAVRHSRRGETADGEKRGEQPASVEQPIEQDVSVVSEASESAVVCEEQPKYEVARLEQAAPGGVEAAAQADISADYIPDAVADVYAEGESAAGDAPEAVADVQDEIVPETAEAIRELAEESVPAETDPEPEAELGTETDADAGERDNAAPAGDLPEKNASKESRRERRRRERAEKKRQKRERRDASKTPPREILLTRSESAGETATDDDGTREFTVAERIDAIMETSDGAAGEVAERPVETVGMLTPDDVIADDSAALDDSAEMLRAEVGVDDADASAEEAAEEAELLEAMQKEAGDAPVFSLDDESVSDGDDGVEDIADGIMSEGDDHVMIIAGGGIPVESYLHLLADEPVGEDAGVVTEDGWNEDANVILFNEKFPVFAGVTTGAVEDEEEISYSFLRMLPFEPAESSDTPESAVEAGSSHAVAEADGAPVAAAEEAVEDEDAARVAADGTDAGDEPLAAGDPATEAEAPAADVAALLGDEERALLLRALCGAASLEDCLDAEDAVAIGAGHVIASLDAEPEPEDAMEREAAIRAEMEREYQSRMDEFASRLLEAQAAIAAGESRIVEKKAENEARAAVIAELQSRLDGERKRCGELLSGLEKAKKETLRREEELERVQGLQDEHERLYKEFEDLRRAYNEMVVDVMPVLQEERDALALTVERQNTGEEKLRSSLGSARRRLAVGYSLAAAACLTLIALPVFKWTKSGQDDKLVAVEHQRISDLEESLQRETQQNIMAQNTIVELENKVDMARGQILELQNKNKELARVQMSTPSGDLAVFRPSESSSPGIPARTSDMALQGAVMPGGRLHSNEVRDPAGSIEQIVAMNREQYLREERQMQMAQSSSRPRAIPVSAVGRIDTANDGLRPSGPGLRPAQNSAPAQARAQRQGQGGRVVAGPGEIVAKVRKGEGVAQVVYRELGTWDPEVVRWVIRENGLAMDARGNPRIHPNQELRLPKDGRTGQSASAAGGRR